LGPLAHDSGDDDMEMRRELRDRFAEEIRSTFDEWLESTWTPWADRNRPLFAVRDLYTRLFELHLRAEADAATHEVVWGHLVLGARSGGNTILTPMLTAGVTIEVDPHDATIR